ncbi:uncharacterized protein LOC123645719 [Lemur catta]|uniref:uncharacterized protein LOC123645719 n=1 Tax=Lemur catta TaxID=9447 RepID=UPI001E26E4AF|nr:uncharacterized protein LOC123645719 [Lemur catta]
MRSRRGEAALEARGLARKPQGVRNPRGPAAGVYSHHRSPQRPAQRTMRGTQRAEPRGAAQGLPGNVVRAAPSATSRGSLGAAGDYKSHQLPRGLAAGVAGKGGSWREHGGRRPVRLNVQRGSGQAGPGRQHWRLQLSGTPAAGAKHARFPRGRLWGAVAWPAARAGDLSLREPPAPALPGRGEVADSDREDAAVARDPGCSLQAAAGLRAMCGVRRKFLEHWEETIMIDPVCRQETFAFEMPSGL